MVLEKTLESPLDCKEIHPKSILKEISPGCSLEGLMLKLKLQYFCHLMRRVDSLEKTLMLREGLGQEEKGTTDDEMAGWHHRPNGHEFGSTPGGGDGQGGLECCGSWGYRESDTTERLNWTELNWRAYFLVIESSLVTHYVFTWQREWTLDSSSPNSGTSPIIGALLPWPHPNLIASQLPCL